MQIQEIDSLTREQAVEQLRAERAANQELRQQLEAIGAGGVSGERMMQLASAPSDDAMASLQSILDGADSMGWDTTKARTLIAKYTASVPSDAGELPKETKWPLLKAMATNYKSGRHIWDGLDADACSSGAEEIRKLRALLAKYGNVQAADAEDAARYRWQPIETAPKNGTEVLLAVDIRAGVPVGTFVGHYMCGGHCIEDHPPIKAGWYFWSGRIFDMATNPTHWMPIPKLPAIDAARGREVE